MVHSWGNLPKSKPKSLLHLSWPEDVDEAFKLNGTLLPFGNGRSYGDSCLNDGGSMLLTRGLNKFINFDREKGILSCQAGTTFEEVLDLIVPEGWFMPVTPGTKFITVGGAIANDIHGKNHHISGNFGNHVLDFQLLRSDGAKKLCSKNENKELFHATIGGLGLTGIIISATFKLIRISSQFIDQEIIKFRNLDEFFQINKESKDYFYTVSWVDCTAKGHSLGRGHFIRGHHSNVEDGDIRINLKKNKLTIPFNFPSSTLNRSTVKLFNNIYYNKFLKKRIESRTHYDPFFYPLDSINHWNRIYGRNGFYQYQFVIPMKNGEDAIKDIFRLISKSGQGSFLAVLKTFGSIKSLGMMSFPREGITLALDFPNKGPVSHKLFEEIDHIVMQSGGALYPAKDSRMSKKMFEQSFPRYSEFSSYIDPKFSSSLWRRIYE